MTEGCILVTGGSRGIGRAVVELLVERGERVAFTYRESARVAEEIASAADGRALPFAWDLLDREAAKPLVERIEDEVGAIDGVVNNAGVQQGQLLAMTPDSMWDRVLDANLGGAFRLLRAVVPRMVRRRRGAIVNVASLGAVRSVAGQGAYSASKAGLLALTRTLAREVGGRGIRVNAVVPGFVATDMTGSLPEKTVALLRAGEALPHGVAAADVAEAIAFLLSDRAAGITGQSLFVDAGASL